MRAFLALPLPDTICDALERLQESIPGGNLIPPENFHLTLAFLGEQPEHALEDLHFSLEAFRATAFGVHLKGLDTRTRQTCTSQPNHLRPFSTCTSA
jgi:2'-5' RNA ligase